MSPNELTISFGKIVRKRREHMGVSQDTFAKMTGHHRTYIGTIERGEKMPTLLTAARLASALKMALSDLLKEAGL